MHRRPMTPRDHLAQAEAHLKLAGLRSYAEVVDLLREGSARMPVKTTAQAAWVSHAASAVHKTRWVTN